jgi:hypothetical protein
MAGAKYEKRDPMDKKWRGKNIRKPSTTQFTPNNIIYTGTYINILGIGL